MMAATTAYYPVYPAHHTQQPQPVMFFHHPGAPTAASYTTYVTPQSPTHVSGGQPFYYPIPHPYPLHQPQHSHGGDERMGGGGEGDDYCRVEIPPSSAASVCCDESINVT